MESCYLIDTFLNEFVKRLPVSFTYYFKPKRTPTLYSTHNSSLISFVAMPNIFTLTTNKGLVNLYDTIKRFGVMSVAYIERDMSMTNTRAPDRL